MDKLKKAAQSTKRFVANHKVGVAVITTAVVYRMTIVKQHEDFLKEKGLLDEFRLTH